MQRSTVIKIASVAGGVVLLAAIIFGVAAISSPAGGPGGLPFIPVGSQPASTSPATVPTFTSDASATAGTTATAGGAPTGTTVATSALVTRTTAGSAGSDYSVSRAARSGSTGTSKATTSKPASVPVKAVKDQLPASVTGYSSSGTQVTKTTAQLALQPARGSTVPMSLALLTVHDFGTPAKAKAFIEKSIKRIYPKNQQTVAVAGGHVFYGTQGSQFGEAAFYSGRYAYEVTVTSSKSDPLGLKDGAVKLTTAFKLP
jgi:hypothetical protein